MGSGFFQRAFTPWHGGLQGVVDSVDPAYTVSGKTVLDPATIAGQNSWLSKESSYDPLLQSGAGKYVNGAGVQAGQNWKDRNVVTSTPTPFAGVTPTMQDATSRYVQATQQAQSNMYGGGAQPHPQLNPQQKSNNPFGSYGW